MYRCKDCSTEYDIKPEYCDCGNNIFEEIQSVDDFDIEKTSYKKAPIEKKSFFEQYPKLKELKDSIDVISGSIFAVCIVLAIFPWIFWNVPKQNLDYAKKPTHHIQKHVSQAAIPSIDSIWDDTAPAQKNEGSSQLAQNQVPSPDMQLPPSQPSLPQVFAPAQPQQSKPVQSVSQTKRMVAKVPSNRNVDASSTQDIQNYKSALRRALFAHLAVTSVQGEGRCQVEFSLDRNGRLLGRKFSRLSDNRSLNDAVYNMLMSVPQFSPPPSAYSGEKIRLSFYFNNGYYEVSF